MPSGFASGLQTVFAYVTIPQVRAAGILDETADPEFGIDDAPLRAQIRAMSHWINRLTDQWFLPVRLKEKADGAYTSVTRLPNLIPILDLFDLRLEREGLIVFSYPRIAYQVKQRYVMMVTKHVRIPDYPHWVLMDGVFGWLVDDYVKVETTLTADLPYGSGVASVADTSRIRVGDAVLIGNNPEPASSPVIVEAVSAPSGPGTITFDPLLTADFTATSGSKVVKYGRVPDLIQRACLLMIRDRIPYKIGELDTFVDQFGKGTRLNSESVEGYSYSMTSAPAQNGFGGGAWTTGNVEVDDILTQFSTPSMYIGNA
jgi:hypothetical protein